MASVEALANELRGVAEYLDSRARLTDPATAEALACRLATSLATKVLRLRGLTPDGATALTRSLEATPFSDGSKAEIVTAIDSRLQFTDHRPRGSSDRTQTMTTLNAYWRSSCVAKLKEKKLSVMGTVQVLVDELLNMGVVAPSEETYRWVMANVSLLAFEQFPPYRTLYDVLQDVKQSFALGHQQHLRFEMIWNYPQDPGALPRATYDIIYPDAADPPTMFLPERLCQVARFHIPLRSNSKLLQPQRSAASNASLQPDAPLTMQSLRELLAANGGPRALMHNSRRASTRALDDAEDDDRLRLHVADGARASQAREFEADELPLQLNLRGHASPPDRDRAYLAVTPRHAVRPRLLTPSPAPVAVTPAPLAAVAPLADFPPLDDDGEPLTAEEEKVDAPAAAAEAAVPGVEAYTSAALRALAARDTKKVAEKRAVLKRPAAAPEDDAEPKMKRPAAAAPAKLVPAPSGKPAGPRARPPCPRGPSEPILYNGGKIYVSMSKLTFRTMLYFDRYSPERCVGWSGKKPDPEAWSRALDAIDAQRRADKR